MSHATHDAAATALRFQLMARRSRSQASMSSTALFNHQIYSHFHQNHVKNALRSVTGLQRSKSENFLPLPPKATPHSQARYGIQSIRLASSSTDGESRHTLQNSRFRSDQAIRPSNSNVAPSPQGDPLPEPQIPSYKLTSLPEKPLDVPILTLQNSKYRRPSPLYRANGERVGNYRSLYIGWSDSAPPKEGFIANTKRYLLSVPGRVQRFRYRRSHRAQYDLMELLFYSIFVAITFVVLCELQERFFPSLSAKSTQGQRGEKSEASDDSEEGNQDQTSVREHATDENFNHILPEHHIVTGVDGRTGNLVEMLDPETGTMKAVPAVDTKSDRQDDTKNDKFMGQSDAQPSQTQAQKQSGWIRWVKFW